MRLKDLCNSTNLSDFVTIQNPVVKVISHALVCSMPKEKLTLAEKVFQANLDVLKPIMVSVPVLAFYLYSQDTASVWPSGVNNGKFSSKKKSTFLNLLDMDCKKPAAKTLNGYF